MKDKEKLYRGAVGKSAAKPTYAASYEKQLADTYDKLASRPAFEYNLGADGLYKKYKDDYQQRGRLAMRDTIGQASALTGGYGSTYAQSVGQQQYDAQLEKLGDIVPELYSLAYSRYQDEGATLRDRYDMLSTERDREYRQYTDALDSYNNERELEYKREQDELERAEKQREQEYQRSQSEAAARAKYGDFGGYAALYGDETAKQMRQYWIAQNPAAAYTLGLISAEHYYLLTGGAGKAAGGASSGGSRNYYPNTAPDGRDAAVVQRELRNQGYNIAVDGAWGPKSQKAWDAANKGGGAVEYLRIK